MIEPKSVGDMALSAAQEQALPADWLVPVIITAVAAIVFVTVAIWQFKREEF